MNNISVTEAPIRRAMASVCLALLTIATITQTVSAAPAQHQTWATSPHSSLTNIFETEPLDETTAALIQPIIDGNISAEAYMKTVLAFYKQVPSTKVEETTQSSIYGSDNKLSLSTLTQAQELDIRTLSNWDKADFSKVCPNPEIEAVIPSILTLESEVGINAVYLMAIIICETGWGKHLAGINNYFNWSCNGVQSFETIEQFTDYSLAQYKERYSKPESYTSALGHTPETITTYVVNHIYAINSDGTINFDWAERVNEIMLMLSLTRTDLSDAP